MYSKMNNINDIQGSLMTIRPILVAPDSKLKLLSHKVETIDNDIQMLLDDMLETMYSADGVGLAAPQLGIHKRIIVIDLTPMIEEKMEPLYIINPEITWVSEEDAVFEEGCLSVPEHYANVIRPKIVKINYLDREGNSQSLTADGLLSTCIQHEIDHLDGILFIDHISQLKRNMILRKLLKYKKMQEKTSV